MKTYAFKWGTMAVHVKAPDESQARLKLPEGINMPLISVKPVTGVSSVAIESVIAKFKSDRTVLSDDIIDEANTIRHVVLDDGTYIKGQEQFAGTIATVSLRFQISDTVILSELINPEFYRAFTNSPREYAFVE